MVRDGKMDLSFRLPAVLMQERDGSQGTNSRLSSWSLSPMDRYSSVAEAREELSPAQIKDHLFLILEVRETFLTTLAQKDFLEVKRRGRQAIVRDVLDADRCYERNKKTP